MPSRSPRWLGRRGRLQGKLEIPRIPTACCRQEVEWWKSSKPEPSEEVRLVENSGWRQRRGGTVVGLAAGLEECAAGWPGRLSERPTRRCRGGTAVDSPAKRRTVARQKNAAAARKGRGDSGGVRVTPPGDGCMVPQVTKSSVGGVRLVRMVGTVAMKTTGSRGAAPRRSP